MVTFGETKFLHQAPQSNLGQFGRKEFVHAGELVSHTSNHLRKPAGE